VTSERLVWNSGGHVDGTTLALMVDAADLRAHLATRGVEIEPSRDVPRGKHPVLIDLWRIVSGRVETAGIDQHTWSAAAGAATMSAVGGVVGATAASGWAAMGGATSGAAAVGVAGPVGWWWGALTGFLAGSVSGSMAGFAAGAAKGARMGAELGEGVSGRISRTLGTYEEVLVAVPNARPLRGPRRAPRARGPYLFVLGMVCSAPLPIWGDRALRFGYQKAPGTIVRDGFRRYEVAGESGKAAALVARTPPRWSAVDARLDGYRAVLGSQPLLGRLDDGSFAVTVLHRFFDSRALRWSPVSGQLDVGAGFVEGVPEGKHAITGLTKDRPWGAFHTERLPVKVTYPYSFGGLSGS
jgi:hypothetical protein